MLTLNSLSVSIADTPVLRDISASFPLGSVTAVLGPNGSGKSTLARAIMGDPQLHCTGTITLTSDTDTISLHDLPPDARARHGVFVSAQSPPTIDGVRVHDIMRAALTDTSRTALSVTTAVTTAAEALDIDTDLLRRALNDGASGGERKKLELLQMAVLDPTYIILDEIDTGVDVDALRTVRTFLQTVLQTRPRALIIITHTGGILRDLTIDHTLILRDGTIAHQGDGALAHHVISQGFSSLPS